MSEKVPAAAEAKTWLKWAEKGYNSKFGSCPLETRIEIGRAWIDLARIEADIEIAKIAASAAAEVRGTDTTKDPRERAEYLAASNADAAMGDWRPANETGEDG